MTELERFRATLAGERSESILYTAGFTPDLQRRLVAHAGTDDLTAHYGLFAPVDVGPRRPADYREPDFGVYYAGEDLPEGTTINGDGVAMIPAGFYHFAQHHSPLRNATSLRQLEAYPVPTQAHWPTDHMGEQVARARQAGKVAACWVGHMYETAWQIRGYEPFLIDMVAAPAWTECLLDKLMQRNLVRAQAAARAGVDYLHCGDDVANQNAMMFSVPTWRKFMLARWSKVWSAALEIKGDLDIWYHSDGNIQAIIDDLLAAGVTILNPIQPECMDPAELRAKYPRLNMHGTIGTQSTMPFGTPEEVRRVVRQRVATCGQSGRLVLAPTHVLEPEVPIANVEAYIESARECGR